MSSDLTKDSIINNLYYDRAGYGSIKRTHDAARAKDKSIYIKYVASWFDKNMGKKKQPTGTNSFVAQKAFFEYQFDLFFINDLEEQKFNIGCVCIDVFSKYVAVVPLQHKNGDSIASGILECFKLMGKEAEMLYTDDEAAISSFAMIEYYKEKYETLCYQKPRGIRRTIHQNIKRYVV